LRRGRLGREERLNLRVQELAECGLDRRIALRILRVTHAQ